MEQSHTALLLHSRPMARLRAADRNVGQPCSDPENFGCISGSAPLLRWLHWHIRIARSPRRLRTAPGPIAQGGHSGFAWALRYPLQATIGMENPAEG
jgi:hypothetical protein